MHAALYPPPGAEQHDEAVGGGSTPEAAATAVPYTWPSREEAAAQQRRASEAAPSTGKVTVTNADGTPYEFSDSSGDETALVNKGGPLPQKLVSPFMEAGADRSFTPVTWQESRRIKRALAKTSFQAALAAYRRAQLARAERYHAWQRRQSPSGGGSTPEAAAAASAEVEDPLELAATPVEADPLHLEALGSQSLGTSGLQVVLQPRPKARPRFKSRPQSRPRQKRSSSRTSSASRKRRGEAEPLIPCQHAPAPTAYTERFQEVDKAEKTGEDLAEKVMAMSLEDNPGVEVSHSPSAVGIAHVSLSSSSSSDSESELIAADPLAAAATAALTAARQTPVSLDITEGREEVHHMQVID